MDEKARVWLASHTHAAAAAPDSRLAREAVAEVKGAATVSVVIPARDEAQTIGPIIASIRRDLMADLVVVDELLVIDSDSTDATATLARDAGATVHSAAEIRPDLGWFPGKGEAMWKSLFVTSGEIVVFIDGDLTRFSTTYITGLLRPLLTDERTQLVKGFYRRDLALPDPAALGSHQGGRVTELVARPLINLWWPALAGVMQPLAGEWAARRELLRSLAIPCGYGVEFAVLVDTLEHCGLDAIAQVDLGIRAHTHQDLASLGTMAAEILAAAARRRGADQTFEESTISQVLWVDSTATVVDRPINAHERPPQATIANADLPSGNETRR